MTMLKKELLTTKVWHTQLRETVWINTSVHGEIRAQRKMYIISPIWPIHCLVVFVNEKCFLHSSKETVFLLRFISLWTKIFISITWLWTNIFVIHAISLSCVCLAKTKFCCKIKFLGGYLLSKAKIQHLDCSSMVTWLSRIVTYFSVHQAEKEGGAAKESDFQVIAIVPQRSDPDLKEFAACSESA